MVKAALVSLATAVILSGCTTTTVTSKDGTTTKSMVPVMALWEHGFDLADTALKSKQQAAIAAPSKGE